MANVNDNQALFSEQLLLLHKFDYSDDDDSPYTLIRHEMKNLDTIALLLCTGLPGEHFSVAFDKREGLEVVLAKNGAVTPEDIADASELFSSLCNPEIMDEEDLLPFVVRRCRANVVKRIQKLRASIVDTGFYDNFLSRLDRYPSAGNPLSSSAIKLEFPRFSEVLEDFINDPLSTVLRRLLDAIVATAVVSEVLDLSKLASLHTLASILSHSRFLQTWAKTRDEGSQKVERFRQCTEKLCRYFHDVCSLIKDAKRLGGPIKYRWVTDESLGIQVGEEDIRIESETPLQAVHRASVLSPKDLPGLHLRYPSIVEPWQQTVHTCLHAELRIILHFGKVSGMADLFGPIGVSKPSCLCCMLWIAQYNRRSNVWWVTRSRSKGDETWALSARACPNLRDPDLRAIDEKVVSEVVRLLENRIRYASVTEYMNDNYEIVSLV